jgi:hypothetical protein
MTDGTLRAASVFPSSRYLVEVGAGSGCSNSQGA